MKGESEYEILLEQETAISQNEARKIESVYKVRII